MTEENKELAVDEIKRRCKALGISVRALCLKKGIYPTSLSPWKKKDPLSIEIYRKLTGELDEMEKEAANRK